MSFAYPSLLWALGLLAIPLLIHLFNFRRYRKLLFTNVHFLKEVLQESRARRNIKHWIILIMRVLALAFLIIAFARPYIPLSSNANSQNGRPVYIYVDNSFSMGSSGEQGPLLDVAREKARQMARALAKDHPLYFISNDELPARPSDLRTFEQKLDELNYSSRFRSTDEINRIINNAARRHGQKGRAYLVSDLQKCNTTEAPSAADSLIEYFIVPVKSSLRRNISIDSLWFEEPVFRRGAVLKAGIALSNFSDEAVNDLSLKLLINGTTASVTALNLQAGEKLVTELKFSTNDTGWIEGRVEIMDHPVVFDDKLYFCFYSAAASNILFIENKESSNFAQKLFETDSFYRLNRVQETDVQYAGLGQYELIVLSGLEKISSGMAASLQTYLVKGGHLAIFPAANGSTDVSELSKLYGIRSYGKVLQSNQTADQIDQQHPLYRGVFEKMPENINAPQIKKIHEALGNPSTLESYPLQSRNGLPVFANVTHGKGNILQSFVALSDEWGNMHRHALFVPIMLNMGLPQTQQIPLYAHTQSGLLFPLASSSPLQQGDVIMRSERSEWIPELNGAVGKNQIQIDPQMNEAGVFKLQNKAGNMIQLMALNHDRKESDPGLLSDEEALALWDLPTDHLMNSEAEVLGESIRLATSGKQLWTYFVALSLLFLLIEIILLRIWKSTV